MTERGQMNAGLYALTALSSG